MPIQMPIQMPMFGAMGTGFGSGFGNGIANMFGYHPAQNQGAPQNQGGPQNPPSTNTMFANFLTLTLSISTFVFVLFLILIFIHYTMSPIFSFSAAEPGLITIPTSSDRQIAFTVSPAASDLSANFMNLPACSYTISSDIYLSGDFMASTFPRVLLYRAIKGGGATISSQRTGGPGNTGNLAIQGYSNQFPDSNLIVWLDPIKNDLFVSVVTNGQTGVNAQASTTSGSGSGSGSAPATITLTTPNRIETTKGIENVPIKKVFRLTVVFTQQFLEVYINGNLEESLAFIGAPITAATNAHFYGPISAVGPNVRLGNIAFWPRTLTAREVRTNGAPIATETFFFKTSK